MLYYCIARLQSLAGLIVGYGNATHSFRANINNFVSITSLSKR